MNKIFIKILLLCTLCFTGCLDDDNTTFFYEQVPIEKVEIPDSFTRGEAVDIIVSYFRPTDCHSFFNFDYDVSNNQRTVTIINVVIDNEATCTAIDQTDTVDIPLTFRAADESDDESYVFRFWQGKDDEDNDKFLEIEVPVIE